MKNLIIRTADGAFTAKPSTMVDTLRGDPRMVASIGALAGDFRAALVTAQLAQEGLPLYARIEGDSVSVAQPGGAHLRSTVNGLTAPLLEILEKAGFDRTPQSSIKVGVNLGGMVDILQS